MCDLGPVSTPKYELPDNLQNERRQHGKRFDQVPVLSEKIKYRYSLLGSIFYAIFIIELFLGGEKNDTL